MDNPLEAIVPTVEEQRNGWDSERLTTFFRYLTEPEYFAEVINRARKRVADILRQR